MTRYLYPLAYLVAIVVANWLVLNVPPVIVWPVPELHAPAGVYLAGIVFSLRNLTQLHLGRTWGFGAIIGGALVSYALSSGETVPGGVLPLSIASAATFALSEAADALVWTKARQHGWYARAMWAGDLAGQAVDSLVFLVLAFGNLDLLAGLLVGKQLTVYPVLWLMARFRHEPARPLAVEPSYV